jgi:REP-associated tyrosine transposase
MGQAYRHNKTSVSLINYHFVWCPKRRRKILVDEVARDLSELLTQHVAELKCEIVALQIMPDHVHLFVNCPPCMSPKDLMFHLKGRSSRILRQKYPQLRRMPSLWTRSYFVSTAGNVSSATVQKYIAEQKSR